MYCYTYSQDKRKSISVSDNYRAIALTSSIGKLLDIIIMRKFGIVLSTCDLQCGFKKNGSTNMYTFMVKETVQYYFQINSNVYAAVLDASQAFDRIEYSKLFNMLIDLKTPPLVIRLLINLYTKQSMSVKWSNTYSTNFGITKGVKKGGILSPVLFCIYMDNLLI